MNDPVISIENMCRDFGSVKALDSLNLETTKGSILALLGPNGAGKTTFLRILMGLIEPTSGQARVVGLPAWPYSPQQCGRIAYVGDRCEPPNWAIPAILEDLQAGAAMHFDRTLFRELCARRNIDPCRPYGAMSKGQRRWILTSLVLASKPELILLDEPADGLDPVARRDLYDSLRNYITECDAAAIVATHVIADVERIADDVAIIDAGRLIFSAPLEDLREQVRQVEIPGGTGLPKIDKAISILGSVQSGDTQILWIRHDGLGNDELREKLSANVTIRTVGLETLYLAIAEHRRKIETEMDKEAMR
jgi:ABC-2 type transport system ATP-binding protein